MKILVFDLKIRFAVVLTLLFLILNSHSFAQGYSYSVQLMSGSSYCPMPSPVICKVQGYANVGSNPCPDSAQLLIEWGDGTTDTNYLEFTGSSYYCYFTAFDTHTYVIPGEYRIRTTFLNPQIPFNIKLSPKFLISPDCIEIDGILYEDDDQNCIYTNNDEPLRNTTVNFYSASNILLGQGFSDSTGYYSATVPSGEINGFYRIATQGVAEVCPNQNAFSTNADTTIDIPGFVGTYLDVKICHAISQVGPPGQFGVAGIRLYALSRDSNSAVAVVEFPDQLEWMGVIEGPAPDSVVGNLYYWSGDFSNTSQVSYGDRAIYCRFRFKTKTTVSLGDLVTFKAYAFSDSTENNLSNNNHIWQLVVGGPYDPNNKLVTPQGNGPYGKVAPETEFTYTVNFQNTGNDTAINVFVIDTLSEHLDLESIEILDSKHPMTVAYCNDRVLRFDFKNIQLPDSGASQEGSKGWFVFSVKAKENLALGTEIRNYVDIYFDYNAPIRTNSTINTIDQGITHPKLDLIAQNNLCFNNDIGAISTQVSGGIEPYNFLWNPKLQGASNDSLTSGIYSVTVIDSNLFMDYNTIEIVDNRTVTANPGQISGNYEVTGGDYHSYEVVENPSSSFDWTVVGGTITQENGHRVKVLWADTMTGSIKVVQTDSNGCIGSTEQSIVVYPLSISEAEASSFSIYPNPTDGIIEIQLNELSGSDRMEILDIQGRVVYTNNLYNTSTRIDLSALASGSYTVRMIGDNVSEERTMVKR
jgi:uncharacterized repeat protein (TIGR01451 family)